MKTIRLSLAVIAAALVGFPQAPSSDREKFIGAWHLISITGPDGKPVTKGVPMGLLMYSREGHVSVQLMYPESEHALSNEYVRNGYEASFGSYDLNQATHTVTHHVQGSNTGNQLVGKDLARVYRFDSDGHLTIRSARTDELWSVLWEHY